MSVSRYSCMLYSVLVLDLRLYKVQQLRAAARSQWPEFC
jgi:hypothetical protein